MISNFFLKIYIFFYKIKEIEANPNTVSMLKSAIKDLQEALVIWKSNIDAPIGSSEIPCCNCVPYPKD